MENEKDKKIIIVTSGVFLCLLAVMLFVTLMRRDNMIESAGRRGSTSEVNLADTSDCATLATAYYCADNRIEYNERCYSTIQLSQTDCMAANPNNIWYQSQCLNANDSVDRQGEQTCATCHEGYRLSNGVCYACNNGYWSEGGTAAVCDACPTGYTCSNGSKYVSAPCCIEGETTQDPQACREDTSAVPGECSSPIATPTAAPTSTPVQNVHCCYQSGGTYHYTSVPYATCQDTYGGSQLEEGECLAQNQGSNYTCYYVHNGNCISDEFLVPCDQVTDVEAYSSLTACNSVPADCCYYSGGSYIYTSVAPTTCQTLGGTHLSQAQCFVKNCRVDSTHQEYLNVSNVCTSCPNGMIVKNGSCSGTEANCCEDSEAPSNITCYYTQDECNPVSPPGNTCNTANGYYDTRSTCVSNLTCPSGKYKTTEGCARCPNGTQLNSTACPGNQIGTENTCCEETESKCSVADCTECSSNNNNICIQCKPNYKLVQGACSLVTGPCCVNGTTYTDDATCQSHFNNGENVIVGACSSCNVEHCRNCLSNDSNKCGVCADDYILDSNKQCVAVTAPCCAPSSGTVTDVKTCKSLANSGVNISLGACGISSVSGNIDINITPSTSPVSTTYSAFDTLGNIIYSGLTWTVSGDGVQKNDTYCKNGICTVKFHHQGTETCGPYVSFATITATDENNSSKTINVTVKSYCDWEETQGTYTFSTQQKTRDAMKYDSGCLAYEGESPSNGQYQYTRRYDRCCGCGGGGGSDPTPTPTPSKQKYCYIKLGNATDNDYCFDYAENCTGYTGPITKSSCGEAEACYLVNGSYVIGKFDGQGYMYVGKTCPATEQKHCYVKYGNGTDNTYCYDKPSVCVGYDETIYGKDSTSCGENNACYRKDSDGSYVVGKFNGQSGYTYYGATCPNSEPACYMKPNGDYYWTDKPADNDVEITSITEEAKCKIPSDDEKCYKDSSNVYYWSKITEADPSWIEQVGITKPEDCNDEDPACYKKTSTGEYAWGKYKNVIGWQPVTGITSEAACKRPSPACYTDPKGKRVWGNYEDDIQYTKVNGVSSYDECMKSSPVIPVPKTALDRFKVIYVTVCVFALAGAGMIVYSKKKKEVLIKKD